MLGIAAPVVEGEVARRRRVVRTTSGAAGGSQKEPVPVSCLDERQKRHGAENEDRDGGKDDSDPQLHVLLRQTRIRRPMAECGQTRICISHRDSYDAGMDTNCKRPVTAICRS